jgi:sialic acid synthase SpsE
MQENIYHLIKNIASRSSSDRIFVIGKGPSLDAIDCQQLPPGLVLNLNDSERIRAGDVAIFSAPWVARSLALDGFQAGFYLSGQAMPASIAHEVLPPLPQEMQHVDFAIPRLENSTFYDEHFVLLNAVKFALKVAELRGMACEVFFLGFDFSTQQGGTAKKAGQDFSGSAQDERDANIVSQEHSFRQFLHYFEAGNRLKLRHVGTKDFSAYSPNEFRRDICGLDQATGFARINLANPDRVLVVAELTNNHLGDPDRLVEMILRSKEAGADLIKVQKRHVDSFYTPVQLASYYWSPFGETLGDYRRGVELTDEMFDLLDETCRENEIEWFSSILDFPSFESIRRFSPRLVKVPSTISNHRSFHKDLADVYHGAIVVSTGFTEQEYVDYVLETFSHNELIYLLHCISAYPTPRSACNIAVVRAYEALRRRYGKIIPGYSSHDLGSLGCMMAVASGAKMLEKHVKLGDVDWIHFDKVAIDLTTPDFKKFIDDVRTAEEITGAEEKIILDCEHHKYTAPVK